MWEKIETCVLYSRGISFSFLCGAGRPIMQHVPQGERKILTLVSISTVGHELMGEKGLTVEAIIWIVVILFVVGMASVFLLRDLVHMKKGVNSKAKARIEEIVAQTVPEGEKVTAAYASWMTVDNQPMKGKTIYRYWWYAIGFNDTRIYIIPIFIDDKGEKISGKGRFCIERSHLGLVNGKGSGNWLELYGKDQKKICTLKVEASNTRGPCHLVDIAQPEAAKDFQRLIRLWLDVVNNTNGVKATGFYNNAKMHDLKAQSGDPLNGGFTVSAQAERVYRR